MKVKLLTLFLAAALLLSFAGCERTAPEGASDGNSAKTSENQKAEEKSAFAVGETWTVDGQWELTVTGVTATDERNEFSEKTPAAVYIVDYTYKNIGYSDPNGFMEGLFFNLDDTIVDNAGKMGYSYPGDITVYAEETPIGASCDGQACIGVDNPGSFSLTVTQYDGNETKRQAVFEIAVD